MPIVNLSPYPGNPSPYRDQPSPWRPISSPYPPREKWTAVDRGKVVPLESVPNWELRASRGALEAWLRGQGKSPEGMPLYAMQRLARDLTR